MPLPTTEAFRTSSRRADAPLLGLNEVGFSSPTRSVIGPIGVGLESLTDFPACAMPTPLPSSSRGKDSSLSS